MDSVNRVFKVTDESNAQVEAAVREQYRSDMQARKFYSQRNMYLTGFTLFLSLILNRVFVLVNDTLIMQDKLDRPVVDVKTKAFTEEIEELRKKLKTRDTEYDELAEKYRRETSTEAKKSK